MRCPADTAVSSCQGSDMDVTNEGLVFLLFAAGCQVSLETSELILGFFIPIYEG